MKQQDLKICVFGDSVTYAGYVKNSWVNLLRWQLEKTIPGNVDLWNLGINAETSSEILQRFETEAQARQANLLIFAFGVNDATYLLFQHQNQRSLSEFQGNVQQIVEKARKITEQVYFVGPVLGDDSLLHPYPPSDKGKTYTRARVEEFNQKLAEILNTEKIPYCNLIADLAYSDFSDGLHPNSTGHRKIFHKVWQQFFC